MVKLGMPKLLPVLILLITGCLQSVIAEVQVSIDRNPVQVNESFQLVFSAEQTPDEDPDFSILQQHFIILRNSRSNSISIINGEYKRSARWTLQLMAKQVGDFMIPAIRFDQERSKPFQVTVKPSSLAAVPHDQLLLEMLVDKPEIPVQGQVILTLRLLSATSISAYQFGDVATQGLDTVIEPLGDVRQYQTRVADRSYLVLEKQYALFPQHPGRLEIPPVIAEVRLPSTSGFDPFRTGGEVRQLRSQPLAIEVEPIPAEFSGPYWLPAGKVELREKWQSDLDNLVAGEPLTRLLVLVADGLTAAQLPELELPGIDGVKQYPDQPVLENGRGSKGISGRREQKVVLIPAAAGRYVLPELELPWWNLETGKMETVAIPAREINVNPAVGSVTEPVPAATASESAADTPVVVQVNRFWIWLSLLLALGWISSAAYWWFRLRRPARRDTAALEHPDLRAARKRLRLACENDDAVGARRALLVWARALLAPREIRNLRQLANVIDAGLAAEIEALDQSLYSTRQAPWQGAALWSLCQQFEQATASARRADTHELLPLNPAA